MNTPQDRCCCKCGVLYNQPNAQVSEPQRAVVYYNPETGEHRMPARADQPLPEIYARQGFERKEIMSMTSFERETGLVHEDTNFNSGNDIDSTLPPEFVPKKPKPEVIKALAEDIAAAAASGPWTGADKIIDSPVPLQLNFE